jgi:hypothetical protein
MINTNTYTIERPLLSAQEIEKHQKSYQMQRFCLLGLALIVVPCIAALGAYKAIPLNGLSLLGAAFAVYLLAGLCCFALVSRTLLQNAASEVLNDVRELSEHSADMLRNTAADYPATKQYIDAVEQHRTLRVSDIVIVRHSVALLSRSRSHRAVC